MGTVGDDGQRDPDALCESWADLHQLRVPRRLAASGLRHPSRGLGRHLAQARSDQQRVRGVVPAFAGHLQHLVARLRRPLLHAARSRFPPGPRRQVGETGLRPAADLRRGLRLHRVTVGI